MDTQQIAPLIIEYQKSGLTQKPFCERQRISLSTLQYHLRKTKPRDKVQKESSFLPLSLSTKLKTKITTIVILKGSFESSAIEAILQGMTAPCLE